MFFMRTVFQHDAAEQQLHYIQFRFKKPKWISESVFVGRIGQMNNYVDYLPSLYYSAWATNLTEKDTKMSEPALAQEVAGNRKNN
jgi:hypothetical protein